MRKLEHEGARAVVARAGRAHDPAVPVASRLLLAARAGTGVAVAVGLAVGLAAASPVKRRAFVAGGAAGLVGAASAALAALAVARRRRPPR
jgi:hypothetical protein